MPDYQAIRDALQTVSWENEPYGIYFAVTYQGRELNGSFFGDKDAVKLTDPARLKRIAAALDELDVRAHALLQKENPDEDAAELELSDIIIYTNGAVSLGYDTGESPAGQLFLYAAFNADFTLQDELIYEVY